MSKSNLDFFGEMLRRAVEPWLERLGKPDANQLRLLVDLAKTGRTRLSDILAKLYPDKVGPKSLVAFSSLRKRLNDAASGHQHDLPDLGLRHQIDSKKKNPPEERFCWFTGPDRRSEAAAEMSRRSVQDVTSISVVDPRAIATTTGAIRSRKRTVRIFVSYSHESEEAKLAGELMARLRTEFAASKKYEINVWSDREICFGDEWHSEIQKAIDDCDFGLLLVSTAFLTSKYIVENELNHFVTVEGKPGEKPVIPVGLAVIDFDGHHDLKGLQSQQIYLLRTDTDRRGRFFSHLDGDREKRDFVHGLLKAVHDALDRRFANEPTKLTDQGRDGTLSPDAWESLQPHPLPTVHRSRSSAKQHPNPARNKKPERNEVPSKESCGQSSNDQSQWIDDCELMRPHFDMAHKLVAQARTSHDPDLIERFQHPLGRLGVESQSLDAITYLKDWLKSENAPPILYLLGEFGVGKTTTLKQLTLELLEDRNKDGATVGSVGFSPRFFGDNASARAKAHATGMLDGNVKDDSTIPLPLFIDLRQYLFDRKQHVPTSIQELLTAVIARNWRQPGPPNVTADELIRLVREERALLIFDGLDEKTVHMTSAEAKAFLRVLWQALPEEGHRSREKTPRRRRNSKAASNSFDRVEKVETVEAIQADVGSPAEETSVSRPTGRLIISCRSHYFRDLEAETSILTGEDRESIGRMNTPVLTLLPFTELQIRNYLLSLFDDDAVRADGAFELISSIHNLGELATRPYLLSLIAERLEEFEELRERGETVNAARLYQLFTQRWLNRDDGKHSLDPVHKRKLMEQLAADLWRDGDKELGADDLELWLDRFLHSHPEISSAYTLIDRKILKEDFRTACFVLREDRQSDSAETADADHRSAFRFAHTSLQEFFLAARLWHSLIEGHTEAFDLPMVSIETLDFLGQMLQIETEQQRNRALGQMGQILGGDCLRAATLAFRYWLRAIERDLPVPKPALVNLSGADLNEWVIRGQSPQQPLNLRGARFDGAQLNRARLEWVDLTQANFSRAAMRQATLIRVDASHSNWQGSDMSGLQWRRGTLSDANLLDASTACDLIHVAGVQAELSLTGKRITDLTANLLFPAFGPRQFSGHSSGVNWCAFSPDGTELVSGSYDNTLKVWDAASGTCRLTLVGHKNGVKSCAFSPDGTELVSGSYDSTLKVWDAASGTCLWTGYQFPDQQWASVDEQQHAVRWASPEAWRWLGWLVADDQGRLDRVPIEAFGPIPGLDV